MAGLVYPRLYRREQVHGGLVICSHVRYESPISLRADLTCGDGGKVQLKL